MIPIQVSLRSYGLQPRILVVPRIINFSSHYSEHKVLRDVRQGTAQLENSMHDDQPQLGQVHFREQELAICVFHALVQVGRNGAGLSRARFIGSGILSQAGSSRGPTTCPPTGICNLLFRLSETHYETPFSGKPSETGEHPSAAGRRDGQPHVGR